jgi:hypothetical protein
MYDAAEQNMVSTLSSQHAQNTDLKVIIKIMALLMSTAQCPRRAPDPRSTVPKIRKQKMLTPIRAMSKPTATGLIARLRFKKTIDTTSYVSTMIPTRT